MNIMLPAMYTLTAYDGSELLLCFAKLFISSLLVLRNRLIKHADIDDVQLQARQRKKPWGIGATTIYIYTSSVPSSALKLANCPTSNEQEDKFIST